MPSLDDYQLLGHHDALAARGLFVAEGRLVVSRLIQDGRHRVHSVLVTPPARNALAVVLARLRDSVPVYERAVDEFPAITGFNIHRGCLALAERPEPLPAETLIDSAHSLLILEGVANADNIGGGFRNAAAFGVDGVLLGPGTGDPLYRKAIRTSMAATLRVPFALARPWPDVLATMTGAGWTLLALTPRADAMPLEEAAAGPRPSRIALLVGSEGEGLSDAAERAAQRRVRIPIRADVDSLNLAVATGIALSRLTPIGPN